MDDMNHQHDCALNMQSAKAGIGDGVVQTNAINADQTSSRSGTMIDPATGEETTFEEALNARYQHLSLLTLDLAQEAGEAVQGFAPLGRYPDKKNKRGGPDIFDRGIIAMAKSIWAHTQIERLRTGKGIASEEIHLLRALIKKPATKETHQPKDTPDLATDIAKLSQDILDQCCEEPISAAIRHCDSNNIERNAAELPDESQINIESDGTSATLACSEGRDESHIDDLSQLSQMTLDGLKRDGHDPP